MLYSSACQQHSCAKVSRDVLKECRRWSQKTLTAGSIVTEYASEQVSSDLAHCVADSIPAGVMLFAM